MGKIKHSIVKGVMNRKHLQFCDSEGVCLVGDSDGTTMFAPPFTRALAASGLEHRLPSADGFYCRGRGIPFIYYIIITEKVMLTHE